MTKLLLIEDDQFVRPLLEERLELWGYEVTACEDAETALAVVQQDFYPLIMLDLGLPGMDGFEFCRRIRAMPRKDHSMILVTTANNEPESLERAFEAGADDYLIKPIRGEFLKMRLKIIEQQYKNLIRQQRTEENVLRLEKVVHIMRLGVTITDPNGTIIYTNPAEARMHGYEVEELIGQDVGIFAPSEKRRPLSLEQVKAMKLRVRESVNVRKDGTTFPVRLISDYIPDTQDNPLEIFTISEDLSDSDIA